jgi:glycosyltransferase involved in cell wall biosynthesis
VRVALDARLVAYQRAGIGNYILGLLRGLREIGREDRVVLLTSRRQPADDAEMAGFRVRRILTPPHHRWEQIGLAIEAAVLPVDLFHAADFIPPLVRRFPAVATVHDLAFLRMPGLLTADSRRYYGQVGRAVNDAERAIAVSDCTRRDLIELVGVAPEQIDVVHEAPTVDPAGASDEAFLAVSRAFALPSRYFLFVGTREPRKNLPRLLQAY